MLFFGTILILIGLAFAQNECKVAETKAKREPFVLTIGKFTDKRDGKTYKTTKIGTQIWMAENLNYATNGSKCYGNLKNNCTKYGRLYSWAAAMDTSEHYNNNELKLSYRWGPTEIYKGICPEGWHLPSIAEWETLVRFEDFYQNLYRNDSAGIKLKAIKNWKDEGGGIDKFRFSALLGGIYENDENIDFIGMGYDGNWWTAQEHFNEYAHYISMHYNSGSIISRTGEKSTLRSIRCVSNLCDNQSYNSSTHFCSGGKVYKKCNGKLYETIKQKCSEDEQILLTKCWLSDNYHNHLTQFCSDGKVYERCGDKEYEPLTHFCSAAKVYKKCGTEDGYNTYTHYCSNGSLKPYNSSLFTDSRDKKIYKTTKIGTQIWMAEDLNYSGTQNDTLGRCWEPYYCEKYGRLYNWNEAMKVCPKGWHLPNNEEWSKLMVYIGGKSAGEKLKSSDWAQKTTSSFALELGISSKRHIDIDINPPDTNRVFSFHSDCKTLFHYGFGGTDDFGFSATAGGSGNSGGGVANIEWESNWWSATEDSSNVERSSSWILSESRFSCFNPQTDTLGTEFYNSRGNKIHSFYQVRCIRD